ncbi:MAG: N-acetylgalactosamine-6-sulfatase, partial [Planctomycetales bacterium]|nr:N-acetylgalactosamine-6-sulfatase [Planctomycetales bacterium]
TLLTLTETPLELNVVYDGEPLVATILGEGGSRQAPLMFRRPPDRDTFYGVADLPDLAIRAGKWKLLCEYDGSQAELYDLATDAGEKHDVSRDHSAIVQELTEQVLAWHRSLPPDAGEDYREAAE